MIIAGWLASVGNEVSGETRNFEKVDSFSCFVVGPVPVFDSFVLASLELHALVVRSIVSNQQGRVLHVVSTGCWIDEVVRAN